MSGIFGTDAAAVYVHTGVYRTSVCIEWPIAHRSAYGLILYVFQPQINPCKRIYQVIDYWGLKKKGTLWNYIARDEVSVYFSRQAANHACPLILVGLLMPSLNCCLVFWGAFREPWG